MYLPGLPFAEGAPMKLDHAVSVVGLAWLLMAHSQAAGAASIVVEAGQTHTLTEDLVLTGEDTLEIRGTAEKPCTMVGNQHRVRSAPKWAGSIKITHCKLQKLGGPEKRAENGQVSGPGPHAFDLQVAGKGEVIIEHCTF